MTVSTEVSRVIVEGNGVLTSWSYSFPIPGSNGTDQTNAELILLGTDSSTTVLADNLWSITGVSGTSGTFSYNPGSPLTTGNFLTLNRIVPYLQPTELTAQGAYSPEVVMAALDNLAEQTEQLNTWRLQSVRAPITDAALSDLPTANLRKGSFLYFDNTTGDVSTVSSTSGLPGSILVGTNSTDAARTTELLITGANSLATVGGVTTLVLSTGLPWFDVTSFGATGNGTTDDTAAVNLTIAAFNSAGKGRLYFPAGIYKTISSLTTITADGTVEGDGLGGFLGTSSAATIVNFTSATGSPFNFNNQAARVYNITLVNSAVTQPSAGAGVTVTSANVGQKVDFDAVAIYGFYRDADIQVGAQWNMHNVFFSAPVLEALRVQNTVNADAGDWSISDSNFYSQIYNAPNALNIQSSGGGKIVNTKINKGTDSKQFGNGISITGTGATSIFLLSNSSIENYSTNALIESGDWKYIGINNLQVGQYGNSTGHAISITSDTDVVINGIALAADTGTPTAFAFSTASRVSVSNVTNNGFAADLFGGSPPDQDGTGTVGARVRITGTPTSGQVPVASSGTAAAWGTLSPGAGGGLVFLEAHTASASATLDFTAFISGTYDEYLLEIVGLQPATDDVTLQFLVGTGGGPTYATSNYRWSVWAVTDAAASGAGGSTSDSSVTLSANLGNASTKSASFSMRIFNPQSATLHKLGTFDGTGIDNSDNTKRLMGSWDWPDPTALTAVRFLYSGGNIASGIIRAYGLSKS